MDGASLSKAKLASSCVYNPPLTRPSPPLSPPALTSFSPWAIHSSALFPFRPIIVGEADACPISVGEADSCSNESRGVENNGEVPSYGDAKFVPNNRETNKIRTVSVFANIGKEVSTDREIVAIRSVSVGPKGKQIPLSTSSVGTRIRDTFHDTFPVSEQKSRSLVCRGR